MSSIHSTAIIDPRGAVVSQSNQFQTEVVEGVVLPMKGSTPYVKYGDKPALLTLLILVGVFFYLASRYRP